MSSPSRVFVLDSPEKAYQVSSITPFPASNVADFASLDILYLALLWDVLKMETSDLIELIDEFLPIKESDEDSTYQFPEDFVTLLFSLPEESIPEMAEQWISKDQLSDMEKKEAEQIILSLKNIASRGQSLDNPLYLHIST